MRWRSSYSPHADGTDRSNPRDAGELYACQITTCFESRFEKSRRLSSMIKPNIIIHSERGGFFMPCRQLSAYRAQKRRVQPLPASFQGQGELRAVRMSRRAHYSVWKAIQVIHTLRASTYIYSARTTRRINILKAS